MQDKANQLLIKAIEMVKSQDIEVLEIEPSVIINRRAKNLWGRCRRLKNGSHRIEINYDLLAQNEDATLETLIHEVLHASKDGMNHGKIWKDYAYKMNKAFNLNIKRLNSEEEKGVVRIETKRLIKYELKCEKCGLIWQYEKKTKFVKNPSKYNCACGGKIKRII